MIMNTDTSRFLQELLPDYQQRARFARRTSLGKWLEARSFESLTDTGDAFMAPSAFASGSRRTADGVLEVRCLVIDDVDELIPAAAVRKALGTPTAIVSSSAGSNHWWYRLSRPLSREEWVPFIAGVQDKLGYKLHGTEAHHVFRLPMGAYSNRDPKKADRLGFRPALIELNPGVRLDVTSITPVGSPAKAHTPTSGKGADIKLGLDDLRTAMSWIVNDARFDERNADWVNVIGHGLKALCAVDEDGFTVYDEWSQPHPKHDTALIRKAWDSFGARGLTSKGGKLKALWQKANPDGFVRMFAPKVFEDDAVPPPVLPGRGAVKFKLGEKKQILSTMENARLALTGLGLVCRYDEFHHRFYAGPDKLSDHLILMLRMDTSNTYGKDFGPVHTLDAITALGLLNRFNPVTDMLRDAEALWDGVKRLDRLGPDYFHTEKTPLAQACFRKVMIAAVRRARQPGCKFDQILVLESPEGWDKSSAWEVLAGRDNFSDADILGKDARQVQEELADIWIHEIADLSGLARAEIERVKAFASRTNDRARPAYGRVLLDQLRQSICVGTTNADIYLLSQTGNRRFWPFTLRDRVELARLREDRLLLWGEAAVAESEGETLVLDQALWDVAGAEQEKRRVVDTWEDELVNLPEERMQDWDGGQFISNLAVQEYLGGYRRQTFNPWSGRKITEIMRRLGWEKCSRFMDGKTHRGYKRAKPIDVMPFVMHPKFDNLF